jgi:hypothetical protein
MQVSTYDTSQICKLITARGNLSSLGVERARHLRRISSNSQRELFISRGAQGREGKKFQGQK